MTNTTNTSMNQFNLSFIASALILTTSAVNPIFAADATTAGKLTVEPATLICLGFEWAIDGDDNRNATVETSYRKAGEEKWANSLPLLRLGGEVISRKDVLPRDHIVPNMFAGSIIDLEPDTEYECRLTLSDPDGADGPTVQNVKVRTRAEPKPFAGGRVFHVYPPDLEPRGTSTTRNAAPARKKEEPWFPTLREAYYGKGNGDWSVVPEPRVQPGDTILVHAGLYKSERFSYRDPQSLPFHGTYVLTQSGTPDKPIVIKAAGDGEVIFDGDGAYRLFDVMAADYNYFEGITVRNTDIAFYAGLKRVKGCNGLTVKNCRLENVGIGVMTEYEASKDFYIADNVMIGREDPYRVMGWYSPDEYGPAPLKSYYAVKVYGRNHVVCHNSISFFHDGIDICTHGLPEPEPDRACAAIDFYNNDIFNVCDDFIETDGGVHNIRVLRNRCINSGQSGLSAQPMYGGPVYFIRNVLYNLPTGVALKFNTQPAGVVLYHNTFCTEWSNPAPFSNGHLRNNLFLGRDADKRAVLNVATYTSYTTFDYNGYRPNVGESAQFIWRGPAEGAMRSTKLAPAQSFKTLADFQGATGQETHGIVVDYDIFQNVAKPDRSRPHLVYKVEDLDFRLRTSSAAVDAGCVLPDINDSFSGKAPDLGAYEFDQQPPHYGPRKNH